MTEPGATEWTPLRLVAWTARYFGERGIPSPRLDAELLLAHALDGQRIDLYLDFERAVRDDERQRFRELVRRRAHERVPVAYLTGRREFWSRCFRVTPDVLIPRPETETLVRVARERAARPDVRILEIGVGSGAVIAALALELPEASLVAVDRSRAALAVARANLDELGLAGRVHLVCADLDAGLRGSFDLLVSNPPYVASGDLAELEPELHHEPRLALDGGADGLDFIRRLAAAAQRLVPSGTALIEVGAGQAGAVMDLFRGEGARAVASERDLANVERVVSARFDVAES